MADFTERRNYRSTDIRSLVEEASKSDFFADTVGKKVDTELSRVYKKYGWVAWTIIGLVAALAGWKFYDLHVLADQLAKADEQMRGHIEAVQHSRETIEGSRESVDKTDQDLKTLLADQKGKQEKIAADLGAEGDKVKALSTQAREIKGDTQASLSNLQILSGVITQAASDAVDRVKTFELQSREQIDAALHEATTAIEEARQKADTASTGIISDADRANAALKEADDKRNAYIAATLANPTAPDLVVRISSLEESLRNHTHPLPSIPSAESLATNATLKSGVRDELFQDDRFHKQLAEALGEILSDPKQKKVRGALLDALKEALPKEKLKAAFAQALNESSSE